METRTFAQKAILRRVKEKGKILKKFQDYDDEHDDYDVYDDYEDYDEYIDYYDGDYNDCSYPEVYDDNN